MKRCRGGMVLLLLSVFLFLYSSAAWSEDLGVTSSGLIDQLKLVLGEEEVTTVNGDPIVIGDAVETVDKAGAVFFTSKINEDLVLSGTVNAQSGKLQNLSVEIAIPEGAESVRLENAVWLHGFFSSLIVSLFSINAAEYQSAVDLYKQNMEKLIRDEKAEAQLDLEYIKVRYFFSGEGAFARLKTILDPQ